ncbi:MAG: FAD-dependent oxidoreductase [Patescibacteria group bacterium]
MNSSKEIVYDYAIVGGGIAGLSTAYHLVRDGHSVVVFDRDNCLSNASFNSTAITSHDPDCDWDKVIEKFGIEGARDIWKLGEHSMKMLAEYAHKVNPHFVAKRLPAHIFSTSAKMDEIVASKYELYKKLGGHATLIKEGSTIFKTFRTVLTVEAEGQSNNQALLKTLVRAVKYHGGKILTYAPVSEVKEEKGASTIVYKEGDSLRAKKVLFATGEGALHPALMGLTVKRRTFVMAYDKQDIPKPFRGSVLWDMADPYHYIRSFRGRTVWVGGSDILDSDYDPKKDDSYYGAVDKFAHDTLLFDSTYKKSGQWSGTFYPAKDIEVPYIGEIPGSSNYANLGFGGTGILMSFVSGYLFASWAKGKETGYKKYFALDR